MENSHERLERLIDHLTKTNNNTDDLFIADIDSFKNLFIKEINNMRTYLNRKSFPIKNERNFELLVHEYQNVIAFWLDNLFLANEKGNFPQQVFVLVIRELQNFLVFIHKRYERFFNPEARVPMIIIKETREKLKTGIEKLRNHLLKECGNDELTELALFPFVKIVNHDLEKKITYHNLFYLRKIEKAFLHFKYDNKNGGCCGDKPLYELMVLMNYNNPEVVAFIIDKIMDQLELIHTIEDKIDKLRFFLKEWNQFKERSNIAYKSYLKSLKEQVVEWISEELIYLCKHLFLQTTSTEAVEKATKIEEKLQLSISAEVLTVIVRAAKDNKLIINKYNKSVFENMSKYVSTKKAENLSVNSLIKKSYDPNRRAKDTAIDILHGMIKSISKQ